MNGEGKKFRFPLRSLIISVIVVVFFVGVIIAYYAMIYTQSRDKIIAQGELDAVKTAEQIDQYLSKGVDSIKLVSFALNKMILADRTQEQIHEYLSNQTYAVQKITNGMTTGLYGMINGEFLDGTDWVPDPDYQPTERPWYIEALANLGQVAIVDPYIDAQTHELMLTFSKTLCDFNSVVAMDLSIQPLQAIAVDIAAQGQSNVEIILDRKYTVIAHSDEKEVGKNYLTETDSFGAALVKQLRSSDNKYVSFRYKGKYYIVYAIAAANDMMCVSVSDATNVFSNLINTLVISLIASLAILSVLIIILDNSNRKQMQFTGLSMHVVEAFAAAIDAKDPYTNGHSARVAEYAREISKRFGYSRKKQNEIYMMGLLHDIGKIGIPDAVINKPGKLTQEEFDVIKKHPEMGAYILSKATEMPRMSVGAHWHHERYDGTGYPDKLYGTNIPEEARIIAVADAYDAMTSKRSYRDALPQEVVRSEIENGKGTQFDPTFADIMLQMIDEDVEYGLKGVK